MNPAIVIRNETDADVSTVTEVTVAAFKTLEISNHTEQFIIEALRAAKALTLSRIRARYLRAHAVVRRGNEVARYTSGLDIVARVRPRE